MAPQTPARRGAASHCRSARPICRAQACPQLLLEVRISNQRAREVYRRYGFEETGRRPAYYPVPQGPREDALLMSLAVAP